MDLRSRIRGAMLGTLVGDALGGPLEGSMPGPEHSAQVDSRLASPRHIGFTDDTAMTFALAEAVVEGFTPQCFLRRLEANFEPARGFGKGTRRAIEAFERGETAAEIAASSWSEGSRGNGAAVRVAPIAGRYWSNVEGLAAHASASAVPTHAHAEAREGAILMAVAIASMLRGEHPAGLRNLVRPHAASFGAALGRSEEFDGAPTETAARALGTSVLAIESIPFALHCFVNAPGGFEPLMRVVLSAGGDTDTIAAMTGALAGAHLGEDAIPRRWIEAIEKGAVDRARALADLL